MLHQSQSRLRLRIRLRLLVIRTFRLHHRLCKRVNDILINDYGYSNTDAHLLLYDEAELALTYHWYSKALVSDLVARTLATRKD
jgi:hypothetical protein